MPHPKQTKIAKVQALLERQQGARLDAICKATGWQPHSVRAALSGLRKAGHVIERTLMTRRWAGPSITLSLHLRQRLDGR